MQYLPCDLIFHRCVIVFFLQACFMPRSLVYLVYTSFLWVSTCLANLSHTFTLHLSSSSRLAASHGIWLDFFFIQSTVFVFHPESCDPRRPSYFVLSVCLASSVSFFSRNSLFLAFLDFRNFDFSHSISLLLL